MPGNCYRIELYFKGSTIHPVASARRLLLGPDAYGLPGTVPPRARPLHSVPV